MRELVPWPLARGLAAVAGACLLALLLTLTAFRPTQPLSLLALGGADILLLAPDGQPWGEPLAIAGDTTRGLSWSPDGLWLVYATQTSRRSHLERVRVDGQGSAPVFGLLAGGGLAQYYAPAWSPNGDQIAFITRHSQGYNLTTITVTGQHYQRLTTANSFDLRPSWSMAGDWIVFASEQDSYLNLYRIRPDGSRREALTDSPMRQTAPHPSPNGDWIAFLEAIDLETARLHRMEAEGSTPQPLTPPTEVIYDLAWSPNSRELVYLQSNPARLYHLDVTSGRVRLLWQDEGQPRYSVEWSGATQPARVGGWIGVVAVGLLALGIVPFSWRHRMRWG